MTEISGVFLLEFFLCTVTELAFAFPTEFKTNIFSQGMDFPKREGIISSRRTTVFENARFRVFADDIADSRGNEVHDFLVVAPRNRTAGMLTGVLVIPVIS